MPVLVILVLFFFVSDHDFLVIPVFFCVCVYDGFYGFWLNLFSFMIIVVIPVQLRDG